MKLPHYVVKAIHNAEKCFHEQLYRHETVKFHWISLHLMIIRDFEFENRILIFLMAIGSVKCGRVSRKNVWTIKMIETFDIFRTNVANLKGRFKSRQSPDLFVSQGHTQEHGSLCFMFATLSSPEIRDETYSTTQCLNPPDAQHHPV